MSFSASKQPKKKSVFDKDIVPRPPMWETKGHPAYGLTRNPDRSSVDQMKNIQLRTLSTFRSLADNGKWDSIHHMHYDWWMFPIDDGSRDEYNVYAEDLVELKADAEYLANYREGVRMVSKAWGWDVDKAKEINPKERGMGWTRWDVRLGKIIRSLWLFEQADYMTSMQKFARMLKPNGGFTYGGICLDEMLYFKLPRTGASSTSASPSKSQQNEDPDEEQQPTKPKSAKKATSDYHSSSSASASPMATSSASISSGVDIDPDSQEYEGVDSQQLSEVLERCSAVGAEVSSPMFLPSASTATKTTDEKESKNDCASTEKQNKEGTTSQEL